VFRVIFVVKVAGGAAFLCAFCPCRLAFELESKNQGESSWVKVDQGESSHFETFFYRKSRGGSLPENPLSGA
jgi:hypothetical protein